MAFTYSPDVNSPEERDYVRFHIGDTVENSGPLPEAVNFSDAEIALILGEEGTWQRTVAACFERLASAWFILPSWQADGLSVSSSHTGKNFADQAAIWRKRYGGGIGVTGHSRSVIRVDGYSDDIASDEIDD